MLAHGLVTTPGSSMDRPTFKQPMLVSRKVKQCCGWTKSCTTLKWETIVCCYFQGSHHSSCLLPFTEAQRLLLQTPNAAARLGLLVIAHAQQARLTSSLHETHGICMAVSQHNGQFFFWLPHPQNKNTHNIYIYIILYMLVDRSLRSALPFKKGASPNVFKRSDTTAGTGFAPALQANHLNQLVQVMVHRPKCIL